MIFNKPSQLDDFNEHLVSQEDDPGDSKDLDEQKNRLLNIIYDQQNYWIYKPQNPWMKKGGDSKKQDSLSQNKNIIDEELWLIAKFMPNKHVELVENDVIRFGRIPFKISEMKIKDPMGMNEKSANSSKEN